MAKRKWYKTAENISGESIKIPTLCNLMKFQNYFSPGKHNIS